jgi:hypothetical protein
MMHLVEILLPLNDNSGRPFRTEKYAEVREHLTERFGGLTAFSRSPAQGTTSDLQRRTSTSFSRISPNRRSAGGSGCARKN